jgi:hypothetical protein
MKRYIGIIVLLLIACTANAQWVISGEIVEAGTHDRLANVFVHDINNKQVALADKNGRFEIKSGLNHLIIFDSPGYISDSVFIINARPLTIELRPIGVALMQVDINATNKRTFDPRVEYPDVYRKSKVYVMSPSTWFSKEGKDARRMKRYFDNEERERYIEKYYTARYVASLVPLKGIELQNFMAIYRPTYAYVKNNNGPTLAMYINDSYQKYKALPPEKRHLPDLNGK